MSAVTLTFNFASESDALVFLSRHAPTIPAQTGPSEAPRKEPKPEAAKAEPKPEKPAAEKTAGDAVDYATLSAAVLKLMKLDGDAAGAIAKELGYETFKKMKEAENAGPLFAKAHAAVTAKIAELEAAGV